MATAELRSEWVQPLVVDKTGDHIGTITAAAVASVMAWVDDDLVEDPCPWRSWLSGPFTKSVRRADPRKLDATATAHGGALVTVGRSRAAAFRPVRYDNLPRDLRHLQVSGTDLPRTDAAAPATGAGLPVCVSVWDELTTGKAAAQAAHALFAWARRTTGAQLAVFAANPTALRVLLRPADELAGLASFDGAIPIRDTGFTEVAPNTLTAVALPTLATERSAS